MSPRPRSRRLSESVAGRVADTMFALATPSRVQILGCLLEGPQTVSELTRALGMEQSAVSHQLRVLRDHRLVAVDRQGRTRVYTLYDAEVRGFFEGALRHVERRRQVGQRLVGRLGRSRG